MAVLHIVCVFALIFLDGVNSIKHDQ